MSDSERQRGVGDVHVDEVEFISGETKPFPQPRRGGEAERSDHGRVAPNDHPIGRDQALLTAH